MLMDSLCAQLGAHLLHVSDQSHRDYMEVEMRRESKGSKWRKALQEVTNSMQGKGNENAESSSNSNDKARTDASTKPAPKAATKSGSAKRKPIGTKVWTADEVMNLVSWTHAQLAPELLM